MSESRCQRALASKGLPYPRTCAQCGLGDCQVIVPTPESGGTIGYMCKIAYDYELGNVADGNKVYPSIGSLREAHTCTDSCGIVEVSVSLVRVVKETHRDF